MGTGAARRLREPTLPMTSTRSDNWDTLWTNVSLATLDSAASYGAIPDGAIAVKDGRIAWVGRRRDLPAGFHARAVEDGRGSWLLPGLIDCHTHIVYAGNRSDEFEERSNGVSYEAIARRGGGIAATVRATRAATVGRTARRQPAPRREPARRGRDDDRDQIGVRARARRGGEDAARRARARHALAAARGDDISRRARGAAGIRRESGCVCRIGVPRNAAGARGRRTDRCGRRLLRKHRLYRGADRAGVQTPPARSACP